MEDFNNDGAIDIFYRVSRWVEDHDGFARMCLNDGSGNFSCYSLPTVGGPGYWVSYANANAGDVDNDGDIDIVTAGELYADTIAIYLNDGNGVFEVANMGADFGGADDGKPRVALGDFNNDGLLDISKTAKEDQVIDGELYDSVGLFENTTDNNNHYLKLKIRGEGNNTEGLHVRVQVFESGTSTMIGQREVQHLPYGNYSTEVHLGLAEKNTVDVVFTYPNNGPKFTLSGVEADQTIIVYPDACYASYVPGEIFPLTSAGVDCEQ